jgi:hypothetical protein
MLGAGIVMRIAIFVLLVLATIGSVSGNIIGAHAGSPSLYRTPTSG